MPFEIPDFGNDRLLVNAGCVRMGAGESYEFNSWHTAFIVMMCESGSGELSVFETKLGFQTGSCVIVPPYMLHSLYSESGCELSCVQLDPKILTDVGLSPEKPFEPVVGDAYIRDLFSMIRQETERGGNLSKPRIIAQLILLFVHLSEEYPMKRTLIGEPVNTGNRTAMIRALKYISKNIGRRLSLDDISRAANMSRYYFCRSFTEAMKCTPIKYINMTKCAYARSLLKQGKSIGETADAVGITNLQYFSRLYKETMGVSPSNDVKKRTDNGAGL